MAIDFMGVSGSYELFVQCQELELNSPNEQYRWSPGGLDRFDPTIRYKFCLSEKAFIRMGQLHFHEFVKNSSEHFLLVDYNRQRYVCEVSRHAPVLDLLEEGTQRLELENMERGIMLLKTEDSYTDREFF